MPDSVSASVGRGRHVDPTCRRKSAPLDPSGGGEACGRDQRTPSKRLRGGSSRDQAVPIRRRTPPERAAGALDASSAMRRPVSTCRAIAARAAAAVASSASTIARCSVTRYSPRSTRRRGSPASSGSPRARGRSARGARCPRGRPASRGRRRSRRPTPRARSPRPSRRAAPEPAICSSDAVSTATSAAWELEREPDVVALEERLARDRGDEVAAPGLDGQEPLGHEPRERVVHGAARDAELGRELVEAELRARAVLARQDPAPQRVVDLLVEVRAGKEGRHGADVT